MSVIKFKIMIRGMEFWNRNKRNDSVFRKLQKGHLTNLKQSLLPTHCQ